MNIFIYDTGTGRAWEVMFPEAVLLESPERGALSGGVPVNGDLLICHRPDEERHRLEEYAAVGVLVIEIAGHERDRRQPVGTFYQRARAVADGVDPKFQACVRNFQQSLEGLDGPNWSLLEGPPQPKNLLAYHLACARGAADTAQRVALKERAVLEANAIADAMNRRRLEDIDDAAKRLEFIRECS
jgi:hypothetical protein